MKQFIFRTVFFTLGGLMLFVLFRITLYSFHHAKIETKNFNSAFVDKLKILEKYKGERKIVLYGGSSVLFGLSAEQIEQSTKIKTINLGHHAGFGLVDFRDFILGNLRTDDILIFSPEWHFYTLPENRDEATLDNLINNNIEYGKLLKSSNYMLRALLIYPTTFSEQYPPYTYNCLNSNGDIITHCNLPSVKPLSYDIPDKEFDYNFFKEVYPFIKNENTIILFPPTQLHVFQKSQVKLQDIEKQLRLNHVVIANSVIDNVYSEANFFDATYHLDCSTRKIRTDSLIQNIYRISHRHIDHVNREK